jgi:pimeloyl-ACP methyl ester carboxylesterase
MHILKQGSRLLLCAALTAAVSGALAAPPTPRGIIGDVSRIVAPNGVQENFKLRIGGIDQWIYTRGQDRKNPVLLFLHGGPASPSAPTMWMYQRPLEEYFTVVNYDQRGAGRTYLENDAEAVRPTLRIGQFVDDAVEIAQAVSKRYGKRKIILVGHSWGTVVGMRAVLAHPELFHAYVGIGQVISMLDNEKVSFDFAMAQARKENNQQAIRELESIAPYPGDTPITRERIVTERTWAQHYGGLAAYRGDFSYYFNGPLLSPEYDDKAVQAIDQGSLLTLERVLKEWLEVDFKPVAKFPVPVVMFMGRHDYTTPSEPTAAWLSKVKAPYKRAVWFENSSHLVQFEEPGKTLVSLLEYVRPLAKD